MKSAVVCGLFGWSIASSASSHLDEDAPDDLDDESRYIQIPHKNDLDLGSDLVRRFVSEEAPGLSGDDSPRCVIVFIRVLST